MPDHSTGDDWTPVGDVAVAAEAAGVFLELADAPGPAEHQQVVVAAHEGRWSVFRDRDSILG